MPTHMHKAEPQAYEAHSTCVHCQSPVKRVPGGTGLVYIHEVSGLVFGPGAPRMTVDPDRIMSGEEVKALATMQTLSDLMVKVYHLLDTDDLSEPDRYRALSLLESGVDISSARYATAVKDQTVSDAISAMSKEKVAKAVEDTERRVASLEEVKG